MLIARTELDSRRLADLPVFATGPELARNLREATFSPQIAVKMLHFHDLLPNKVNITHTGQFFNFVFSLF